MSGTEHLIPGGGLWFFLVIKLFFTPRLDEQFLDLIKSKQFFVSCPTPDNLFFSPCTLI